MKRILVLLAGLVAAWSVSAKVDLPEIMSSNMMLQQNTTAHLWGWADPHARVKIATSWGAKATVTSGADGRWLAGVKTPAGSYQPQTITITSGEEVVLDNVLIGEVWFAGGQSNMEMGINCWMNCPVAKSNEVIARANTWRDKIRYVKITKATSMTPEQRAQGRWNAFTPQTAPWCSAVGFFFAERLNQALDVPVGIIDCTWGGSRIESWIDRETLEKYDVAPEELSEAGMKALWPDECLYPLTKFNGMVNPVTDYTIRGFLWYQGESNLRGHDWYAERMADMVALWRRLWREGEIPFYYVECAPYDHGTGDMAARMREAQVRALDLISNSGIVCTNDLVESYERTNIHPRNKHDIGYRLAYQALRKTYGFEHIICDSPQYESMAIREGRIYISMKNVPLGYERLTGIEGFEICGADRMFRPAHVEIGSAPAFELSVWSPEVPEPVAVRYCFKDFQQGNLITTRGLPAFPFRTDDFPPVN